MRVKALADPVEVEPPRSGEDASDCVACNTPDDAYIWVSERWRVRAMDRPTGLPVVLILECRSHLDLGDLPNLLAAELGVMTVRLERAIRSLDGVARVHVNRWGDGSAHLHMWFLARPYGRLQLRGTFLSLWDDILPVIPEQQWRGNLALVAAWLAEFGGQANAEPPHIEWQSPSTISESPSAFSSADDVEEPKTSAAAWRPADLGDVQNAGSKAEMPLPAAYAETAPIEAAAPLNATVASTEAEVPPQATDAATATSAAASNPEASKAETSSAGIPTAEASNAEATNVDEPPLDHANAEHRDDPTATPSTPTADTEPVDSPATGWMAEGKRVPHQRDAGEPESGPTEPSNASQPVVNDSPTAGTQAERSAVHP